MSYPFAPAKPSRRRHHNHRPRNPEYGPNYGFGGPNLNGPMLIPPNRPGGFGYPPNGMMRSNGPQIGPEPLRYRAGRSTYLPNGQPVYIPMTRAELHNTTILPQYDAPIVSAMSPGVGFSVPI
ncbi:unnamed protein product [Adineta ricciae]|uniref:Uncharacterized protein n=2 Tax=Adineta ricciae TaxID=249248 RepID=A0A815YMZ7_ADIRI|nr:unnamed protein product [Adineta ricciae]